MYFKYIFEIIIISPSLFETLFTFCFINSYAKIESELLAKSIVTDKHVNFHTSLLNFATSDLHYRHSNISIYIAIS